MARYVEDAYAEIVHAYTGEFFDDTSELPLIDHLVEKLKVGDKVLDIGSGPVQLSKLLNDMDLLLMVSTILTKCFQ